MSDYIMYQSGYLDGLKMALNVIHCAMLNTRQKTIGGMTGEEAVEYIKELINNEVIQFSTTQLNH